MFEITGLNKATLKFESVIAATWAEVQRCMDDMRCEFYNLTVHKIRWS